MSSVRILYFTRDYTSHDYRFLTALAKTGYEVHYLRLESRGYPLEDRSLSPEIEQVHWAGGRGRFNWRDSPRLLGDLKRVIRILKPDLIQAGPLQTAAFLVALTGFRPLVSMSWGYDLLLEADRNAFLRWATRYTLRHSAAMIGDCNTIRQRAESFGMPAERIVTFPWGVDLQHFVYKRDQSPVISDQWAAQDEEARQPFTLLSTRGWEPIYGVELIARAYVQAARQRPELRLLMLGNGSQAPLIHRIFKDAELENRVSFPGHVGYTDLPRYYRSADLYVSASHSDGSSISLLEAMACGCPTLVSDIPGNREWVTPGVQGWWFCDGDVNALGQAVVHAVEERSCLPEMGRAARALAEQRADWDKNYPELLKAYKIAFNL